MTIVVDASAAVRWLFQTDSVNPAENYVRPGEKLIAPDVVITEIASAAWKLVAFENFEAGAVLSVIAEAARIFDEVVPSALLVDHALRIAIDLHHPVYDCFYLALAQQRDCRMLTADERLIKRCAGTQFANRVLPLTSPSGRRR